MRRKNILSLFKNCVVLFGGNNRKKAPVFSKAGATEHMKTNRKLITVCGLTFCAKKRKPRCIFGNIML